MLAIGALVDIQWLDDGEWCEGYYISFSDPNHWETDPLERDQFGVRDDQIFYYCSQAELELGDVFDEFVVLDHELVQSSAT